MKRKKKRDWLSGVLILMLATGFILLIYPLVSDWWNSFHQSRAIGKYSDAVEEISEEDYSQFLADAHTYNRELADSPTNWLLSEEDSRKYQQLLDPSKTGIIGYVEIPKIKTSHPIYHGTDEEVLQVAVGHLPGSSLPVGGESTHSVLTGHRGLPSARLFTDLDELEKGDLFVIHVLNEVMTYEVDQILIVKPEETESLKIVPGEDLCTLITCTPYGINSHRLLVRGRRTENVEGEELLNVVSDARQISPILVAPWLAIPVLLIFILRLLFQTRKTKTKQEDAEQEEKESGKKTKEKHPSERIGRRVQSEEDRKSQNRRRKRRRR